jgi:hypothetical protein
MNRTLNDRLGVSEDTAVVIAGVICIVLTLVVVGIIWWTIKDLEVSEQYEMNFYLIGETAIQRVARQSREKEDAFYEEHGMSSAEYFHESGYSDADSERILLEEREDE